MTVSEPSLCSGVYNATASGGFFGRTLQASIIYTSRTCYNMTLTINLNR